jgi:hypothetical protein
MRSTVQLPESSPTRLAHILCMVTVPSKCNLLTLLISGSLTFNLTTVKAKTETARPEVDRFRRPEDGDGASGTEMQEHLACWLMEKAADNTFQPADSNQLIKAACAFVEDEILTKVQELSTNYARPARFSRITTHP